jgi:hypothetical protein
MKLRHAAALALVGWYLMMPPTSPPNSFTINEAAPLSKWYLIESFDSAESCKRALAEKGSAASDRFDTAPGEFQRFEVRAWVRSSASPATTRASRKNS